MGDAWGFFSAVQGRCRADNDAKASFSSYGASWMDVAAPGVAVYSTFPNHRFALASQYNRSQGYDIGRGTSMASPMVAAVAALAWSTAAGTSSASVRDKVESTADPVSGTGTYWAHGRVNACKAVGNQALGQVEGPVPRTPSKGRQICPREVPVMQRPQPAGGRPAGRRPGKVRHSE